ncbi:MAG: excisionase family DNA-binding protein [Herpetosiphonaceae bacterium]|nr:excisionase family DNA-binding protein [Herpetosiphonaceae bacterium]
MDQALANTASNADAEWISLHEASSLLGVATSTLRRWGDAGRVPTMRTLGGHRRFQRQAVEQLRLESQPEPTIPDLSTTRHWSVDHHALTQQDWHTRLAGGPTTDRMRGLGQRLLGILMQYINGATTDNRLLVEAAAVGETYGSESQAIGVSMHDTVEAFLFFRRAFAQLAKPHSNKPVDVAAVVELRTRLDHFMDEVLLGTIEGYEHSRS